MTGLTDGTISKAERHMRKLSGWEIVRTVLGFPPVDKEANRLPTQEELESPSTYTPGGLNLDQYYPDSGRREPSDEEGDESSG